MATSPIFLLSFVVISFFYSITAEKIATDQTQIVAHRMEVLHHTNTRYDSGQIH